MAKKLIEDARNRSAKQLIRRVLNRTVDWTDQSSRVHREEKARRLSNQIRLAGRQGRRLVIQDGSISSANQKALENSLDEPSDGSIGSANHSHRSDYLRSDYLRTNYLRTDFLRTDHPSRLNRRLSQSQPSVGLSSVGLSSDGLSSDGSSFGQKPSR